MRFQLLRGAKGTGILVLTDLCLGVIVTYNCRIQVICEDAREVAEKYGFVLWDDDRFILTIEGDQYLANGELFSDWEVME